MGFANFQRDREKSASIAASLSLGGILLLVVSSIVLTRSPGQIPRLLFPDGDYKIYLSSEQPEEKVMAAGGSCAGIRRHAGGLPKRPSGHKLSESSWRYKGRRGHLAFSGAGNRDSYHIRPV